MPKEHRVCVWDHTLQLRMPEKHFPLFRGITLKWQKSVYSERLLICQRFVNLLFGRIRAILRAMWGWETGWKKVTRIERGHELASHVACDLLLFTCLYETPHLVSVVNMAEIIDEDAFKRHQTCKAAPFFLQLQSLNIKHAHHPPCLSSKFCAWKKNFNLIWSNASLLHCDAIKSIKSAEGIHQVSSRRLSRESSQVCLVHVPWEGQIWTTS